MTGRWWPHRDPDEPTVGDPLEVSREATPLIVLDRQARPPGASAPTTRGRDAVRRVVTAVGACAVATVVAVAVFAGSGEPAAVDEQQPPARSTPTPFTTPAQVPASVMEPQVASGETQVLVPTRPRVVDIEAVPGADGVVLAALNGRADVVLWDLGTGRREVVEGFGRSVIVETGSRLCIRDSDTAVACLAAGLPARLARRLVPSAADVHLTPAGSWAIDDLPDRSAAYHGSDGTQGPAVAMSPSAMPVATVGEDLVVQAAGAVYVVEPDGAVRALIDGVVVSPTSIDSSASGLVPVRRCDDRLVCSVAVVDAGNGAVVHELPEPPAGYAIALSPDGNRLAVAVAGAPPTPTRLLVVDLAGGTEAEVDVDLFGDVRLVWSADSRWLGGMQYGLVVVWDVADGRAHVRTLGNTDQAISLIGP